MAKQRKARGMEKIQHVVIIVKENHTFDNYFGTFPGADGKPLARAANPPPDDPNHRHEAWMARASNPRYRLLSLYCEDGLAEAFDLSAGADAAERQDVFAADQRGGREA